MAFVAVAFLAALYAKRQLDEAKTARLTATADAYALQARANRTTHELQVEVVQPYVVVHTEQSKASERFLDIVVKNYGQTAAYDVRVTFNPVLYRPDGGQQLPQQVHWPEVIATVAPGQEYRVWWDSGLTRADTDLPKWHQAWVTYIDAHGRRLRSRSVLDWGTYEQRMWAEVKGVHELTKTVEAMSAAVQSFREDHNGGLRAYVRDGAAKDEERRAWSDKVRNDGSALERMVRGTSVPETGGDEVGSSGGMEPS